MPCLNLADLPTELLEQVMQHLETYDQLVGFGMTNKRFRGIAARLHTTNQAGWNNPGTLTYGFADRRTLGLGPNPSVEPLSDKVICAMDCGTLVTWDMSAKNDTLIKRQSISFDTRVLGFPNGRELMLCNTRSFTISRLFDQGPECTRQHKRLIGNKNFAISPSGRLVGCMVNNFGQRYAEVHDIHCPLPQPICCWPTGLLSLDFAKDERLWAYVTSDGRAILRAVSTEIQLGTPTCDSWGAVKFSQSGGLVAISKDNGTVSLFNLLGVEIANLGSPSTEKVHTLSMDFCPSDRLLMHHAEIISGTDSWQELRIWSVKYKELIFSYCIDSRAVSRFEVLGFLSPVSGVLVLLNGSVKCWVFPPTGVTKSQPVIQMTARASERTVSARLSAGNNRYLALGCESGDIIVMQPPSPVDLLERNSRHWKLDICRLDPPLVAGFTTL